MQRSVTRPVGLLVAVLGTWLSGLVFVGLAIGSMVQGHGRLSLGVALMLASYGLLLGWVGFLGWRRRPYARGLIVGSGLLHLASVATMERVGSPVLWILAAAVPVAVVVAGMLPSTARALGIAPRGE